MRGILVACLVLCATPVVAQDIPQHLSQQQLEEYVAVLLYDRVQMLKDADKDKMALMDQKRVADEQAAALAAYWRAYVDGLTRKK